MVPQLFISRTSDGSGLPLPSYESPFHRSLRLQAAVSGALRINPEERVLVPVGFAIALPPNVSGFICSDQELAKEHGVVVLDAPAVLEPAHHDPIFVLLQNMSAHTYVLRRATFIANLVIMPSMQVCWKEVKNSMPDEETSPEEMLVEDNDLAEMQSEQHPKREVRSIRDRYKKDEDE